jgi:hypothetical protein
MPVKTDPTVSVDWKTVRDPPRCGPLALQYMVLATPGTYTVTVGPGRLFSAVWGGGGGGGGTQAYSTQAGGGGGAGGMVFGYADLDSERTVVIEVGAGGAGGGAGAAGGDGSLSAVWKDRANLVWYAYAGGGGGGGGATTSSPTGAGGYGGGWSYGAEFVVIEGYQGGPGQDGWRDASGYGHGGEGGDAPSTTKVASYCAKGALLQLLKTWAGGSGGQGAVGYPKSPCTAGSQPGGGGGGGANSTGCSGAPGMVVLILAPL